MPRSPTPDDPSPVGWIEVMSSGIARRSEPGTASTVRVLARAATSRTTSSRTAAAAPPCERTLRRWRCRRAAAARRSRSRPPRPTCPPGPRWFIAAAIQRKCSTNLTRPCPRRAGRGRELDGDLEHVLAEQRHPGRAVRLLQIAAGRQRRAAVEDADVVEAEEAALEDVLAEAVLAVHPPGEVQQQLVERRLEELDVGLAVAGPARCGTGTVVAQAWTGGFTSLKFHS